MNWIRKLTFPVVAISSCSVQAYSVTVSDDLSMDLYGVVNQSVSRVDDGHQTNVFFGDNDMWPTHLGVFARTSSSSNVNVGGKLELGLFTNSSASFNQVNNNITATRTPLRYSDVWLSHHTYGTISIGLGDTASKGSAVGGYLDWNTTYSGSIFEIGNMYFHQKGSADDATSADPVSIDVFNNLDGLGRASRLKYQTIDMNGIQASASVVSGNMSDVSVSYNKDFSLIGIRSVVSYAKAQTYSNVAASGGVQHLATGWNFNFAYGKKNLNQGHHSSTFSNRTKNPNYLYSEIGRNYRYFDQGKTKVGVNFFKGKHFGASSNSVAADNSRSKFMGLGITQEFNKYNLDVYLSARKYSYRSNSTHYDPIKAIVTGARFYF